MYRADNEPVTFTRDVDAIIVPAGLDVKLRQGQQGYITQALGGSFTVYVEGNLFRIAGKDADALGKEPDEVPELPPNANDDDVRRVVWDQMKGCYDPEIPINIVDLGLVYDLNVDGDNIATIDMTLTSAACPLTEMIEEQVSAALVGGPDGGLVTDFRINWVWLPPWGPEKITEAGREQMRGRGFNI